MRTLLIVILVGFLGTDITAAVPTLEQAQQISSRTGRPILVMAGADT